MTAIPPLDTSALTIGARVRLYWSLIKSLQPGLLLMTGVAGYLSAHVPFSLAELFQPIPSLFLAISGSTILNMWWDRDIDEKMKRTHMRPGPAGFIPQRNVLIAGLLTSIIGVCWALLLSLPYGAIVFAGWFFDVIVYSVWLKRRTC